MSAGDWKDLFQAASQGKIDLVKYHIENGVDPNYQHPEILMTPLVESIKKGHADVALFLIDNGADPKLESLFDGFTAI